MADSKWQHNSYQEPSDDRWSPSSFDAVEAYI